MNNYTWIQYQLSWTTHIQEKRSFLRSFLVWLCVCVCVCVCFIWSYVIHYRVSLTNTFLWKVPPPPPHLLFHFLSLPLLPSSLLLFPSPLISFSFRSHVLPSLPFPRPCHYPPFTSSVPLFSWLLLENSMHIHIPCAGWRRLQKPVWEIRGASWSCSKVCFLFPWGKEETVNYHWDPPPPLFSISY